jgi:hypothetical protein
LGDGVGRGGWCMGLGVWGGEFCFLFIPKIPFFETDNCGKDRIFEFVFANMKKVQH